MELRDRIALGLLFGAFIGILVYATVITFMSLPLSLIGGD